MTPIEEFLQILITLDVWLLAKFFVLLALLAYIVFAFLILREAELMNKTLNGVFNAPIRVVALFHLIFALFVFILALVIL